jgi:hypothetical protein
MRGFFKAHPPRQLTQLVATNDELAGLPVDMAQPGLRGDDAV